FRHYGFFHHLRLRNLERGSRGRCGEIEVVHDFLRVPTTTAPGWTVCRTGALTRIPGAHSGQRYTFRAPPEEKGDQYRVRERRPRHTTNRFGGEAGPP